MSDTQLPDDRVIVERLRQELAKTEPSRRRRIIEKFVLAALGSIPWIGGFLSAAYEYRAEEDTLQQDSLQTQWLEEHQEKISELRDTLSEIEKRFDTFGSTIEDRIQSKEYLCLVRKAFRAWDEADTHEKRRYIANLIINAAGTRVCSDDVIRLFIDWLELYHEAHFAVIREIFQYPGSTRYEIWSSIYGDIPREDSAEADLYKLLIRDLSTGSVIRQERDTNALGQFIRKRPTKTSTRNSAPTTMESAFENTKPYVLTEMGKQFVHYTMNEAVTRLEGDTYGN
ncbi:hypothetical protein [Lysobacter enzymogenes]|uniref:hypothetical protein n=1 Tax=Lysobacter enzymogenes TaxID=69 RepID=UPI001A956D12|nr:hypothetical protein [Lysobacter enzymogenes]QQP96617.1 hypothetical protein JHW38_00735 [Lysobacter enzymogenes]